MIIIGRMEMADGAQARQCAELTSLEDAKKSMLGLLQYESTGEHALQSMQVTPGWCSHHLHHQQLMSKRSPAQQALSNMPVVTTQD